MKWLVCLIALLVCMSASAFAAKRVALVVGNSAYTTAPLKNPVNDAIDMAGKLRKLGFEVTLLSDAGQKDMEQGIRAFGGKLAAAEIRLFYYAGHGMQVKGSNYLIPVDADVADEHDVKYESVDAGRVLEGMDAAGKGVNILILDACRNNPFARSFRSSSRGLARMDAPSGTVIVYATAPGDVAMDGNGRNGMFTKHLLSNIDQSGLTLEQVFKRAGKGVATETHGDQQPWISLSLYDDIFLSGGGEVASYVPPPGKLDPATEVRTQQTIHENGYVREVTTKGSCAVVGMTAEQAIHMAKQRARSAAIEQAAGVRISSSSLITDGRMGPNFLRTFANGFIVKEKARWSMSSYQNDSDQPPIPQYDVELTSIVVIPEKRKASYGLEGFLNRNLFRAGEKAVLTVQTRQPARIAVFNLMADGNVTMLFPLGRDEMQTPGNGKGIRIPTRESGVDLAMQNLPGHKVDAEGFFIAALGEGAGKGWLHYFKPGQVMAFDEFFSKYAKAASWAEDLILPYEVIANDQ